MANFVRIRPDPDPSVILYRFDRNRIQNTELRAEEATAELEMDQEDGGCVSVEAPEISSSNLPDLLFNTNSGSVPTSGVGAVVK